jgi:hypothetical protein
MNKNKIILPVVAEAEICGVKIKVRAAKYGLVRAVIDAENDESRMVKMAELASASCEFAADGSPVDINDFPFHDVIKLANLSLDGKADFQIPPAGSPSSGAE